VDFDTAVKLSIYETIAQTTQAPSSAEVAKVLNAPPDEVEAAFARLHKKRLLVPEPGDPSRIRMAPPFSGIETPFRVTVQGRAYYANCAVEATPPTWSLSITATVSMTRAKSPGSPSGRGSKANSRSSSSESVLRRGYRSGRRTSEAFRGGSGRFPVGRRSCGPGGAARFSAWGIRGAALRWPHSPPRRARSELYRQPLDSSASADRSRPRETSRRSSRRLSLHASAAGYAYRPSLITLSPSLVMCSPLETGHFQCGASIVHPSFILPSPWRRNTLFMERLLSVWGWCATATSPHGSRFVNFN